MLKTIKVHRLIVAVIILIVFAALCYISKIVYFDFPFCMDEYNYLYQAKIFASGHMYVHADPKLRDLFETYMVYFNGKLFSKFPPVFPALLTLGIKLGIPGLINPLISVATAWFIYLIGAALSDSLFSVLALLLIVSNGYFLGYGASYFSQPLSLFLTTVGLFTYLRYKFTQRKIFLTVTALSIALAIMVRPLDAFCLWIVLFFDLGFGKTEHKPIALILFGMLSALGAALLFLYFKILTGDWVIAPFPVFHSDFNLFYTQGKSVPISEQVMAFLKGYYMNFESTWWPLLRDDFIPNLGCWIPFIFLSFSKLRQESSNFRCYRNILLSYILIAIVLYNVGPWGWNQYGARYWYFLITPLALFVIQGLGVLYTITSRRIFWVILGALILWQVGHSIENFKTYSARFEFVLNTQVDINESCPAKSIVIITQPKKWFPPAYVQWQDFQRNPFLSGPRLYLWGNWHLKDIQSFYPDYSVCYYHFKEVN